LVPERYSRFGRFAVGFFLDVAARAPEGPHEIMAIGEAFGLTFPAPVEAAA
jgi:hypothetical protein